MHENASLRAAESLGDKDEIAKDAAVSNSSAKVSYAARSPGLSFRAHQMMQLRLVY